VDGRSPKQTVATGEQSPHANRVPWLTHSGTHGGLYFFQHLLCSDSQVPLFFSLFFFFCLAFLSGPGSKEKWTWTWRIGDGRLILLSLGELILVVQLILASAKKRKEKSFHFASLCLFFVLGVSQTFPFHRFVDILSSSCPLLLLLFLLVDSHTRTSHRVFSRSLWL
jgi:hypothetical protein